MLYFKHAGYKLQFDVAYHLVSGGIFVSRTCRRHFNEDRETEPVRKLPTGSGMQMTLIQLLVLYGAERHNEWRVGKERDLFWKMAVDFMTRRLVRASDDFTPGVLWRHFLCCGDGDAVRHFHCGCCNARSADFSPLPCEQRWCYPLMCSVGLPETVHSSPLWFVNYVIHFYKVSFRKLNATVALRSLISLLKCTRKLFLTYSRVTVVFIRKKRARSNTLITVSKIRNSVLLASGKSLPMFAVIQQNFVRLNYGRCSSQQH